MSNAPGDPAEELARRRDSRNEVSKAEIAKVRHQIGLDRPFFAQYEDWLKGAVHGDLGTSFLLDTPVTHDITQRVPATLELTAAAFAMICCCRCRSGWPRP